MKIKLIVLIVISLIVSIPVYLFTVDLVNLSSPEPINPISITPIKPTSTTIPTPTPTPASTKTWQGRASWYGRDGCLGCSENMIMANGQPLDDSAFTVAFNKAKLGTMVRVTNTKTDLSVVAEVSDTGGFERHGKIIDLVPAVRDAIQCGSVCEVEVREI